MPTAEARVETARAERYLAQLCDHLGHMRHGGLATHHHATGHGGPPDVQRVEHAGDRAVIVFNWGQCTLHASANALIIRAEATDDAALTRAQALIGRRIETIGRREHLTVTWLPRE